MPLVLVSPAFPPGGAIPAQYTCSDADISPPLSWSGVAPASRSLVLVVDDPDAPSETFYHWAVFDIPAGAHGLAAGYRPNRPASVLRQARNGFGEIGYGGPCPPPGPAHHYRFRLLAISRPQLDLAPAASGQEVLRAAEPCAVQRAVLTGSFRR